MDAAPHEFRERVRMALEADPAATPSAIARSLGCGYQRAYNMIDSLGMRPNSKPTPVGDELPPGMLQARIAEERRRIGLPVGRVNLD